VVAANAAAATLLGRPLNAVLGADALDLAATPEDQAWWAGAAGLAVENLQSEALVTGADGQLLHTLRSIGLIRNGAGGAPTHALVMLCDRSAEHAALDESERAAARALRQGLDLDRQARTPGEMAAEAAILREVCRE
jgi:PAS domain-containing protein